MTVLALLAVPVIAGAALLPRRRCKPVTLLALVTLAQVFLHESMRSLATPVPDHLSAHTAHLSAASAMGGDAVAHGYGWSGTMKTAHVVAIVGTALLLAHGEQALARLARWLLPTPPRLPRLPVCGPRMAVAPVDVLGSRPSLATSGSGLRGPPLIVAAIA